MSIAEIESLLKENGYVQHIIYGFYSIPKKNLGYYFYINGSSIMVGKIKWGAINIKEIKTINSKSFDPHNYSLVTNFDKQRIATVQQRMLQNQNKQKELLKKNYKELPIEPQTPTNNE